MHAGKLAHALDRLTTVGRVLHVGAHPDDENTCLLAYLVHNRHLTTAYLSMTRGGGGQNLIGTEQGDMLGVIRTHELMAARGVDSAWQRFSRMRDFGFSKSAAETLDIWGHEAALSDVVWIIRTFQPDIVITRFDELPPNHGHHTASAILAREAYAAAADPECFPEQLTNGVSVWQAARLLHNIWTWDTEAVVPQKALPLDINVYDTRLGLSYGELAALSRSQHQSQGFGVPGERGPIVENFVFLAGSRPIRDPFDGIDFGWQRYGSRAESLQSALGLAQTLLTRDEPDSAVPALIDAHRALDALPEDVRVRDARRGLEEVVAGALGLFMRVICSVPSATPTDAITLSLEVNLRRPGNVRLTSLAPSFGEPVHPNTTLEVNTTNSLSLVVQLPAHAPVSAPYWLAQTAPASQDIVTDALLVGEPYGPAPLSLGVEVTVDDRPLRFELPVLYTWIDPLRGERMRPFIIVPPATVTPVRDAVVLPNGNSSIVELRVRAGRDSLEGTVHLNLPIGWHAEPEVATVALAKAQDELTLVFTVSAPIDAKPVTISPSFTTGDTAWNFREDCIDYGHIPTHVVLQPARLKLVPVSVHVAHGSVGYVHGAGDLVPDALAQIGINVELLDDDALRTGDLSRFTTIVLGIRAYNTRTVLRGAHARLMAFVELGGNLVVQYNTNNLLAALDGPIGPYPMEIGRGRVTDQSASMTFLQADHPVVNHPNRITADDFDGWVQERGLYFAASWDATYTPVFASHDADDQPLQGGLLAAQHGKGRYIYTGLSFFRQLPAGVPGAYRLFSNLLAGPK